MVVNYFRPSNDLSKGIIKANYISNTSQNILINYSSCDLGWDHIYPSACLEDNECYYQNIGENSTYSLTFQKHILITHFAVLPRKLIDSDWWPYKWSLEGCRNDECQTISSGNDPNYFATTQFVLTPVLPGVFNTITFKGECEGVITIKRIEFFGFTCDSESECRGDILLKTLCKRNQFKISITYFIITIGIKQRNQFNIIKGAL